MWRQQTTRSTKNILTAIAILAVLLVWWAPLFVRLAHIHAPLFKYEDYVDRVVDSTQHLPQPRFKLPDFDFSFFAKHSQPLAQLWA
jgi:type II secretory pathway component PulM